MSISPHNTPSLIHLLIAMNDNDVTLHSNGALGTILWAGKRLDVHQNGSRIPEPFC
jgi:hypothetical protein